MNCHIIKWGAKASIIARQSLRVNGRFSFNQPEIQKTRDFEPSKKHSGQSGH